MFARRKRTQDPQLGSPQEMGRHSLAAGGWPNVVNTFMDKVDLHYCLKVRGLYDFFNVFQ